MQKDVERLEKDWKDVEGSRSEGCEGCRMLEAKYMAGEVEDVGN